MSTDDGASKGVSNCYIFKIRLQEFAQKQGFITPVYHTIKEGPSHQPSFRSTAVVNNVKYDSLTGFLNRKAAEQSAAEVALLELESAGVIQVSLPVHETGLCKNLLQEYAQKMNFAIPSYESKKDDKQGRDALFTSSVDIGGIKYIGGAAKTKKHAELKASRTALLAIESARPESTQKPSGDSVYTVVPTKRKEPDLDMSKPEKVRGKPKRRKYKRREHRKRRANVGVDFVEAEKTCKIDANNEEAELELKQMDIVEVEKTCEIDANNEEAEAELELKQMNFVEVEKTCKIGANKEEAELELKPMDIVEVEKTCKIDPNNEEAEAEAEAELELKQMDFVEVEKTCKIDANNEEAELELKQMDIVEVEKPCKINANDEEAELELKQTDIVEVEKMCETDVKNEEAESEFKQIDASSAQGLDQMLDGTVREPTAAKEVLVSCDRTDYEDGHLDATNFEQTVQGSEPERLGLIISESNTSTLLEEGIVVSGNGLDGVNHIELGTDAGNEGCDR